MKTVEALGALSVQLAGSPLGPADAACLAAISVRQALSVPAQCELLFRGTDAEFGDRAAVLAGLGANVSFDGQSLFAGEITAIEHAWSADGGREIRIRAYHRYLERGGGHGMDFEDWLEAKRELRELNDRK